MILIKRLRYRITRKITSHIKKIFSYKKISSLKYLRKTKRFELPIFTTKIKEYSFCTLSVKFLDRFGFNHLEKTTLSFKNYLYLHELELHLNSLNFLRFMRNRFIMDFLAFFL